jgi:hypothetical protein
VLPYCGNAGTPGGPPFVEEQHSEPARLLFVPLPKRLATSFVTLGVAQELASNAGTRSAWTSRGAGWTAPERVPGPPHASWHRRAGERLPPGRYTVTHKLDGSRFGPYHGCCTLALSAHQPNLPPGWPGGDRLAIHGTDAPGTPHGVVGRLPEGGGRPAAGC